MAEQYYSLRVDPDGTKNRMSTAERGIAWDDYASSFRISPSSTVHNIAEDLNVLIDPSASQDAASYNRYASALTKEFGFPQSIYGPAVLVGVFENGVISGLHINQVEALEGITRSYQTKYDGEHPLMLNDDELYLLDPFVMHHADYAAEADDEPVYREEVTQGVDDDENDSAMGWIIATIVATIIAVILGIALLFMWGAGDDDEDTTDEPTAEQTADDTEPTPTETVTEEAEEPADDGQQDELDARESDLDEREGTLDEREGTLDDRESELDERETAVEDSEGTLEDAQSDLEDRSSSLDDRESELDDRESDLDDRESSLDDEENSDSGTTDTETDDDTSGN